MDKTMIQEKENLTPPREDAATAPKAFENTPAPDAPMPVPGPIPQSPSIEPPPEAQAEGEPLQPPPMPEPYVEFPAVQEGGTDGPAEVPLPDLGVQEDALPPREDAPFQAGAPVPGGPAFPAGTAAQPAPFPAGQAWGGGYPPPFQPYPGAACDPYQTPYPPCAPPAYPAGSWAAAPGNAPGWAGVPGGGLPPQQPPFQPQANPWYGVPPYQALPPRKKKMSLGLKVFLWIASLLTAATIFGFIGYMAYNASPNIRNGYSLPLPDDAVPEEPDDDDIPDFDDGVAPPKAEEDGSSRPDVDVTPNHEGISILKKPEGTELDAKAVYNRVAPSTVTVVASYPQSGDENHSTGTGIIATSDGYIITNSHVVLNSKSTVVEITTYDGEKYDAVVVGVDRTTDLAILKTNDHGFSPAEFGDAGELSIGDSVIAIGNPGGERFSGSMTGGYVSGLDRAVGKYSENGMTYIQTDAAINPGNSGGPLVNMYGQVVGINSSKIISDGYEGMGFAIPVSNARPIINELLSGGYVKGRTRLGIQGRDVDEIQHMYYGLPQGFTILRIDEDSSFSGTKAQEEDIITALDGQEVSGLTELSNLLLKYAPGDQVEVTLYRPPKNGFGEGTELTVTITLLEDKGETQK